jgi:hypothetical protein
MTDLERQLYDLQARADADPFFDKIGLFVLRPRYNADGTLKDNASFAAIQSRVDAIAGGLVQKNGGSGLTVTFLMPSGRNDKPNVDGPQTKIIYSVRVSERIEINMGPRGTGVSAEEVCIHLAQLFHLTMLNGRNCLFVDPNYLQPVNDRDDPNLTYLVHFLCETNFPRVSKVATPIVAPNSGAAPQSVTLTCATAGAAIYYTTDGSYPSSKNGTLYGAPIDIEAACILRAAAEKAGMQQSSVQQGYFT